MKFLIDAMFSPEVAKILNSIGHDAVTPADRGGMRQSDQFLIQVASVEDRVIVTENWPDFAGVTTCPVLFVRKSLWPSKTLSSSLAASLDRWAAANPSPGAWAYWLDAVHREAH